MFLAQGFITNISASQSHWRSWETPPWGACAEFLGWDRIWLSPAPLRGQPGTCSLPPVRRRRVHPGGSSIVGSLVQALTWEEGRGSWNRERHWGQMPGPQRSEEGLQDPWGLRGHGTHGGGAPGFRAVKPQWVCNCFSWELNGPPRVSGGRTLCQDPLTEEGLVERQRPLSSWRPCVARVQGVRGKWALGGEGRFWGWGVAGVRALLGKHGGTGTLGPISSLCHLPAYCEDSGKSTEKFMWHLGRGMVTAWNPQGSPHPWEGEGSKRRNLPVQGLTTFLGAAGRTGSGPLPSVPCSPG